MQSLYRNLVSGDTKNKLVSLNCTLYLCCAQSCFYSPHSANLCHCCPPTPEFFIKDLATVVMWIRNDVGLQAFIRPSPTPRAPSRTHTHTHTHTALIMRKVYTYGTVTCSFSFGAVYERTDPFQCAIGRRIFEGLEPTVALKPRK